MSAPRCTCGSSDWFVDGRSIYCRICKSEQASESRESTIGDRIALVMVALGFIGLGWWLL